MICPSGCKAPCNTVRQCKYAHERINTSIYLQAYTHTRTTPTYIHIHLRKRIHALLTDDDHSEDFIYSTLLICVHALVQTTITLKKIFVPVKQKLEQKGGKMNETKLDVLAGINLALECLDLAPTQDRRYVCVHVY